MTYKIERVVRERLSQIVKPVSCRFCGEDIIFIDTKTGSVPVNMELERHKCTNRRKTCQR
jgi:hypothetical protein